MGKTLAFFAFIFAFGLLTTLSGEGLPSSLNFDSQVVASHKELEDGTTTIHLNNGLTLTYSQHDLFAEGIGWKDGDRVLIDLSSNVDYNLPISMPLVFSDNTYILLNLSYQGAIPVKIAASPEALTETIEQIDGSKILLNDGSTWSVQESWYSTLFSKKAKDWKEGDRIVVFPTNPITNKFDRNTPLLLNLSREVKGSPGMPASVYAKLDGTAPPISEYPNQRDASFTKPVVSHITTVSDRDEITLSNGVVLSLPSAKEWKEGDSIQFWFRPIEAGFSSNSDPFVFNQCLEKSYMINYEGLWKSPAYNHIDLVHAPRIEAVTDRIVILDTGDRIQIFADHSDGLDQWKAGNRVLFFNEDLPAGLVLNFELQKFRMFGYVDRVFGVLIY